MQIVQLSHCTQNHTYKVCIHITNHRHVYNANRYKTSKLQTSIGFLGLIWSQILATNLTKLYYLLGEFILTEKLKLLVIPYKQKQIVA